MQEVFINDNDEATVRAAFDESIKKSDRSAEPELDIMPIEGETVEEGTAAVEPVEAEEPAEAEAPVI